MCGRVRNCGVLVAAGSRAVRRRPLRVLVVEDHEILRRGLRWVLTRVPWVESCVGAGNAEEALALAESLGFDVALVDVDLGDECGLRVCEQLAPRVNTALLTSRWDLMSMRTARAAGARGAIGKDVPVRELLGAVHALALGGACEPAPARP